MSTGAKVRVTVVRHEQREEDGTELAVLYFLQHVLEDGAPQGTLQGFMRALYDSNDTPQRPNEGTSEDCSLPSQRERKNRTECL